MSRWLALLLALLGAFALPTQAAPQSSFERGLEAYRRGDYAAARELWQATLAEELDTLGRARVYYDLGNAHWRLGATLPAIACFTAAVRLDPRHDQAWQNLELARAKASLPPADAGDLGATLERLLNRLRPDERRTLLFAALVLWAVVLVLEIRAGGAVWRAALFAATLLVVGAALPWAHGQFARARRQPLLVIATGGVALRGEPLEARAPVGELAALEEVERLDALPGWVRVQRDDGTRGWVRAENVFALQL
ncbi:MAG: tetratricopeptide repeat protein [Planctomycetes bacterium]|nr:tetratricopeptide repeat protein [Planctomycetota bacterium]